MNGITIKEEVQQKVQTFYKIKQSKSISRLLQVISTMNGDDVNVSARENPGGKCWEYLQCNQYPSIFPG
jgi:hypothetical protein